jgi:hypothetical protein
MTIFVGIPQVQTGALMLKSVLSCFLCLMELPLDGSKKDRALFFLILSKMVNTAPVELPILPARLKPDARQPLQSLSKIKP